MCVSFISYVCDIMCMNLTPNKTLIYTYGNIMWVARRDVIAPWVFGLEIKTRMNGIIGSILILYAMYAIYLVNWMARLILWVFWMQ
jgi:hypothetical protein